ncbi:hypothetical protein [Streptomyces sp. NBC_00582]|uniref:hypothetical protein n=1 Tax=Streptomyces sp. NBC_00582 TaxID=2975783 RepID=UPI002E813CE8|nr:hypothetical protein [Streptomyces sp. NBC_00582]
MSGCDPQIRPLPHVSCEANATPGSGITTRQVVKPEYTGPGWSGKRVRRTAEWMPDPAGGLDGLAAALALAVHRSLTGHRELLVARYELALEATRRPELRAFYDTTGAVFRDRLTALAAAFGSADPARHALSLVAWADGLMFSCVAGSYSSRPPGPDEVRTGLRELLGGMLDR